MPRKAKLTNVSENNDQGSDMSSFTLYFFFLILNLLIGVFIIQNGHLFKKNDSTVVSQSPANIDQVLKAFGETLKKEIIEASRESQKKEFIKLEKRLKEELTKPKVEKPKNNVISEDPVMEDSAEIKINKAGESIVIDPQSIQRKEELAEAKEKKKQQTLNVKKSEPTAKPATTKESKSNFKGKKISRVKPKKMWIPIPNRYSKEPHLKLCSPYFYNLMIKPTFSNGGHRRCPAIEVKPDKEHASSVKIWLYEEFLSTEECENLIKVHETHVQVMRKQKPIICFNSLDTLRRNLVDLNRLELSQTVTNSVFTEGTFCLNQTFSRQLEKWGLRWSYSTAFYPGESKFSRVFGKRIEEATQLEETHGGKFQVTSYASGVGYKSHMDCVLESDGRPDRYATFLVYLNDMGADNGGETLFTELGRLCFEIFFNLF